MNIKGIKSILHDHKVAEMPSEVVTLKNRILLVQILSTAILDVFSFSIKGAQYSLNHEMHALAFIFLICYFLKQVLQSSFQAYADAQRNSFSSLTDSYISQSISEISNTVRGKVFQEKEGYLSLMGNSEIIMLLKEYIGFVWNFWQDLPIVIADIVIAVVMAVTILVTEFLQTNNAKHTIIFSIILLLCTFVFIGIFKLRIKVRDNFRKKYRESRKENEKLFNDIRNIEPLVKREFGFRVKLLVNNLVTRRYMEKKEIAKLNYLRILKNCILACFMISIICLKMESEGGLSKLTIEVMTDILAVSAVYSNIIDKISKILSDIEGITHTLKEAGNSKEDVDLIMCVYYSETEKEITHENVSEITVLPFSFSYPGVSSVYKLKNSKPFTLEKGKSYGVFAPTGAGKSTFMHLITGKIQMDESPISYGDNCKKAYLASIMNEANGILGSNSILHEITFGEEIVTYKLLKILKGCHIYYDIMRNLGLKEENDNKVLEYLQHTTINQYSSGQKQRLGIIKLLYNMTEDHQIIVFDEATNALDDETARKVLKFIAEFCQEDVPRIVLFVSHQEELTRKITDGNIVIVQNHFPAWEILMS